jgi:hypothetical protein
VSFLGKPAWPLAAVKVIENERSEVVAASDTMAVYWL